MGTDSQTTWLVPQPGSKAISALGRLSQLPFVRTRMAVAYVSEMGVYRLEEQFSNAPHWATSSKLFLVGMDHGLTQPEALERLRSLPSSEIRVPAIQEVLKSPMFRRQVSFHPKCYAFDVGTKKKLAGLFIGSNNLTHAGMSNNTEFAVAFEAARQVDRNVAHQFEQWWSSAWSGAEVLTDNLLEEYREGRATLRQASPASFVDEEPSPAELGSARCMWIESGFLSGGSHNQLELPQGIESFFGLVPNSGTLRSEFQLKHPNGTWNSWLQFWGNGVWRIRLPTVAEGAPSFHETLIRFDRTTSPDAYRIDTAPEQSARALRWVTKSQKLGTVRHTLQASGRKYGWF